MFNNRKFDTHQLTFALGEALAHLHALWYGGELSRSVGDDGVVRFGVRGAGLSRSPAGTDRQLVAAASGSTSVFADGLRFCQQVRAAPAPPELAARLEDKPEQQHETRRRPEGLQTHRGREAAAEVE